MTSQVRRTVMRIAVSVQHSPHRMKKFVADRPFADPDAAARKMVEMLGSYGDILLGRVSAGGSRQVDDQHKTGQDKRRGNQDPE